MRITKIAKSKEIYLLDEGVLYDEDAEEVFNMKRLIKYFSIMKEMGITKIPKFYDAEEANKFISLIEAKAGDNLGRVLAADVDPRKTIRYKDTREERDKEKMKMINDRNERVMKGRGTIQFEDPEDVEIRKTILREIEEKEAEEERKREMGL